LIRQAMTKERPSILLVTSNGTGMGHLTRQTAIARALGERADCVVLSLSSGIDVVATQGIRAEYLPSYQRPWIPREVWNHYLADRLVALAEELNADVVAFDGVAPYRGIAAARGRLPRTAFVWFRRGMWRPGRNSAALRAEPFFDLIIEPGDFAQRADRGRTATRSRTVINPISLLDVIAPLARDTACSALGLDPAKKTALISLGSGALGDDASAATAAANILRNKGWQIATTKAALATSDHGLDGAIVLRDVYPLAEYVNAFDLVVSSAGYNAVHEFVSAGIPTVLIPNVHTATDDQVTRARTLDEDGAAIWVDPQAGEDGVPTAVDRALEEHSTVGAAAATLAESNRGGTYQAADLLLRIGSTFSADSPDSRRRMARRRFWARGKAIDVAMNAIGETAADKLRQSRGSRSPLAPTRPLTVDLVLDQAVASRVVDEHWSPESGARPVTVTDQLVRSVIRGQDPVEHILAGTSTDYLTRRLDIARRAYDVKALYPRRDADG
jgi:hypothetical protein